MAAFRGGDLSELRILVCIRPEDESEDESTHGEAVEDDIDLDEQELEDELRALAFDEAEFKELVGDGKYEDFLGLCVKVDYYEKRLEL